VQSFSKDVIRWGCLYDKSLKSSDIETIVGRLVKLYSSDALIYDIQAVTNHFTFWKCDRGAKQEAEEALSRRT
jgi:hypothetical protein